MLTPAQLLPLSAASPLSSAPAPAIEQLVGELIAVAACLVAAGLRELREHGQIQMGDDVRQQGGELMGTLIELRQATAGALDFDRVAKEQGARALQERSGDTVSQHLIDELVAAVIEILAGIVKLRLN